MVLMDKQQMVLMDKHRMVALDSQCIHIVIHTTIIIRRVLIQVHIRIVMLEQAVGMAFHFQLRATIGMGNDSQSLTIIKNADISAALLLMISI